MDWIVWTFLVVGVVTILVITHRHKRIKRREEVRERLLGYRLEDMPKDEMKPLIALAESVGLDWDRLLDEREVVQQSWRQQEEDRRARVRREHEHLLRIEQEERQRQQAQEDEAIASILAAMDDPQEIEAFKREHGMGS